MLYQINVQISLQQVPQNPVQVELDKIFEELEELEDPSKENIINLLQSKDIDLNKEKDKGVSRDRAYQICLLRSALGMAIEELNKKNEFDYPDLTPQKPHKLTMSKSDLYKNDKQKPTQMRPIKTEINHLDSLKIEPIIVEDTINEDLIETKKLKKSDLDKVKEVFSRTFNCLSSINLGDESLCNKSNFIKLNNKEHKGIA